jgi:hypothetical protein
MILTMEGEPLNMKRIQITILTLILMILVTLTSCKQVPEAQAASDKYRLVWNDDPTSTITIIWDQLVGKQPTVFYGKKDFGRKYWKYKNQQTPARKLIDYYLMNTCYAKLENLEPDQTYFFVIKDSVGVSNRFYFQTAPDKPKAFTFITGGDTKSVSPSLEAGRASNTMVAKLRPLFVLFNGDFTSGNGTRPDYWYQWLKDWDSLTTTPDGRKIPIVPGHGNHENGNKSILNKIFDAPFQFSDNTNIYYSLSFGGQFFHIIVLNSEIDEGGSQREWLKTDLEDHKDFCFKVAGYHKPFRPHTSEKKDNDYQYDQWAELFYDFGLDLAIEADSHMHKITYPLTAIKVLCAMMKKAPCLLGRGVGVQSIVLMMMISRGPFRVVLSIRSNGYMCGPRMSINLRSWKYSPLSPLNTMRT